MANRNKKINYKAFIPITVAFIGAGVTFMISVNSGIRAGLIGVRPAFFPNHNP